VSVHNLFVMRCTKHFQILEATDQCVHSVTDQKYNSTWQCIFCEAGRELCQCAVTREGDGWLTSQIAMQFTNVSLLCVTCKVTVLQTACVYLQSVTL
jgi:hypothetical protein